MPHRRQAGADTARQEAVDLGKKIPKEVLERLNKILGEDNKKETPEHSLQVALTPILESFVALLRGRKDAKNVDVKLYLDDYEKLMFKIEYIDASSNDSEKPLEGVRKNQKSLKSAQDFSSEDDCYNIFKQYGLKFAEYALLVLGEAEAQKEIEEIEKDIKTNVRDSQKHATLAALYARTEVKEFFLNGDRMNQRYGLIGQVQGMERVHHEEAKDTLPVNNEVVKEEAPEQVESPAEKSAAGLALGSGARQGSVLSNG